MFGVYDRMANKGIQFGDISKDRKLLKKYEIPRHIDEADSQAIDELANIRLIDKKLDLKTFKVTAQTSELGRELFSSLSSITE